MIYIKASYQLDKPTYCLEKDYYVKIECDKENFIFYVYYISSSGFYKILNLLKTAKNRRKPSYTATSYSMGLGFTIYFIKRLSFPLLRALQKLQPSWFGTFFNNGLPPHSLPPKINIVHRLTNNIAGSYTIEGVPILI